MGGNTPRAVHESSPGVPKHKRQSRQYTPGPNSPRQTRHWEPAIATTARGSARKATCASSDTNATTAWQATQPPAAPSHCTRHTKSCHSFLAEGIRGIHQVDSPFSMSPQPRETDQTKKGVGANPSKLPTPVRAARLEAWLERYVRGQKQKLVSGFKRGFDVGYKGSLPRVRPHN